MQGEVVHTWRLPHRPGLYGYLLDDGRLFYSGKVSAAAIGRRLHAVCISGRLCPASLMPSRGSRPVNSAAPAYK